MSVFLVIDELPSFPTLVVGIYGDFEGAVEACDEYIKVEVKWFHKQNPFLELKVDETECLRDYILPNEKRVGFIRKVYSMTGFIVIKIFEIEVE